MKKPEVVWHEWCPNCPKCHDAITPVAIYFNSNGDMLMSGVCIPCSKEIKIEATSLEVVQE